MRGKLASGRQLRWSPLLFIFVTVFVDMVGYGLARGLYANEAGYGTAAVAYGTAKSQHPEQQGLAAMAEVEEARRRIAAEAPMS